MTWREDLRDASFRGVPFLVDSASSEIGRRTVIHEFPGSDMPYGEDLGKAARKFKLEAYVVGDGYMVARDRLRAALERSGSGRLVHPYWGEFDVVVDGRVSILESTREGGLARFTLAVVQAAQSIAAVARTDAPRLASIAADVVDDVVAEEFVSPTKGLTLVGQPASLLTRALAILRAATSLLRSIRSKIAAVMHAVDSIARDIEAFSSAIEDLVALPGQLVAELTNIITDVLEAVETVGDSIATLSDPRALLRGAAEDIAAAAGGPLAAFRRVGLLMESARKLFAFGDDVSVPNDETPAGAQAAQNRKALVTAVRAASIAATVRLVTRMELDSYTTAASIRDELVDRIDELEADASDNLYAALEDLKRTMFAALTIAAGVLPRVVDYTPAITLPALAIAYDLYGDATRDAELIARNAIRHPVFVAGGVALEVLADE